MVVYRKGDGSEHHIVWIGFDDYFWNMEELAKIKVCQIIQETVDLVTNIEMHDDDLVCYCSLDDDVVQCFNRWIWLC